MSDTEHQTIRAAELRRRIRAAEQLRLKTCELAAADVLAKHKAARKAAEAKQHADTEASESTAAALRLFGDTQLVADLTELPARDLNRVAKSVTAARAVEVVETLRERAEPARSRQRRDVDAPKPSGRSETAPPSTPWSQRPNGA